MPTSLAKDPRKLLDLAPGDAFPALRKIGRTVSDQSDTALNTCKYACQAGVQAKTANRRKKIQAKRREITQG